jgi:CubicO group peptidase (beta-lactamase class C family)
MDQQTGMKSARSADARPRPSGARRVVGARRAIRSWPSRLVIAALTGASGRCRQALRVATGFVGRSVSTAHFQAGLDPAVFYDDYFAWRPVFRSLRHGITVEIDRAARTTEAHVFGIARARARFGDPLGTLTVHDGESDPVLPATGPPAERHEGALIVPGRGRGTVTASDQRLARALAGEVARHADGRTPTKALVVVKDGVLLGEAYGEGYGPETPIIGYSLAKTLANTVAGRMAALGLLALDERDLCPEWSAPGDRRRDITPAHLLQMTSGLDIRETHSGFDPVSHMLFLAGDMGAFAAGFALAGAPGAGFDYTCGNTMLLARLIRDRLGTGPYGVWRFLDRELFAPLGMERMLVEYDASGTPILSTFAHASARDWARLGLLYLNDGRVGAGRLLPEGWVTFSVTATAEPSYGAGVRLNRAGGEGDKWLIPEMPEATFYAHGHLGQYVVVIPALRAVIVRLGASSGAMRRRDMAFVSRLAAFLGD